jgi:hypoxanthine phosphoribosyltransferase
MATIYKKQISEIVNDSIKEFFSPIINLVYFFGENDKSEDVLDSLNREIELLREQNYQILAFLTAQEESHKPLFKKIEKLVDTSELLEAVAVPSYLLESENSYIISHIAKSVGRSSNLISKRLIPGDELTSPAAEIGIANIEYLLSEIENSEKAKPYLFGINKGGAFIANYLAHRINLHEKYLVKCDYRADIEKIYCERRDVSGPIVIIDDVARTGKTIHAVKSYLSEIYSESKIFTIVLVASCGNKQSRKKTFKEIDYSPWFTYSRKVTLPWSKDDNAQLNTDNYFNDKEVDQIKTIFLTNGDA